MPTNKRHYLDSQPYYCLTCGGGIAEYMACDEPNCQLEGKKTAKDRRERTLGLLSEEQIKALEEALK